MMGMSRFAVAVALVGLAVSGFSGQRKHLIAHGWEFLAVSTEDVHRNRAKFAATGVDGIMLSVDGRRANGGRICGRHVMKGPRWKESEFEQTKLLLRDVTACDGLRESYGLVNWTPSVRLKWDDDEAWDVFASNFAMLARIARQGGLKGVAIDHEDYSNTRQFKICPGDPEGKAIAKLARRRGREVFAGFFKEFPDARVLSFWMFSEAFDRIWSPSPRVANFTLGDLWVSFLNGMLDVMPSTARMIDGCEYRGYQAEAEKDEFRRTAWDMIRGCEALVEPENRPKYRTSLSVSFGQYLDFYINSESSQWYRGPRNGSRLAHLAENLSSAVLYADDCIWFYGEKGTIIDWDRKDDAKLKFPTWESLLPGLGRLFCVASGKRDPKSEASMEELFENPECNDNNNGGVPKPYLTWTDDKNPPKNLFAFDGSQGAEAPGCVRISGKGSVIALANGVKCGDIIRIRVKAKGPKPVANAAWRKGGAWKWDLGSHFMVAPVGAGTEDWRDLGIALIAPNDVDGVGVILSGSATPESPVFFDDIHFLR